MVNFATAVAYHFCLNLPAAFTKPGQSLLADPCTKQHSRCISLKSYINAMASAPKSAFPSGMHIIHEPWIRAELCTSFCWSPCLFISTTTALFLSVSCRNNAEVQGPQQGLFLILAEFFGQGLNIFYQNRCTHEARPASATSFDCWKDNLTGHASSGGQFFLLHQERTLALLLAQSAGAISRFQV